jgi:antitoxin HigA-1
MDRGLPLKARPVHPGEVLREDVIEELGLSVAALARALDVQTARLAAIVREERPVTAEVALRLAAFLGGDAQSWLNLQSAHDLRRAEHEHGRAIRSTVKSRLAAAEYPRRSSGYVSGGVP